MKNKLIALLLTLFTLTAILSGCGSSAPKAPEKKAAALLKEIKITYVKAPLNIPSIVDKNNQTVAKGFEKDGTKATFPEITSGAKQTEALAAGSLGDVDDLQIQSVQLFRLSDAASPTVESV